MRFKLTIDRGNTAIKAALWSESGELVAAETGDESFPAGDLAVKMSEKYLPAGIMPEAIAWCTVVASEHEEDKASLESLPVGRVVELSSSTPMRLTIGYRTPETLGSDRLAAVLGALYVAGDSHPLLVSDIGTAVTYDFVERGRHYVGGNIAPGIDLRLRALAAFTDALPAVSVSGGDIPLWGQTTAEAMRSGAVRGLAAELAYYHAAAGEDTRVVLTGGSAALLAHENILTFDFIHDPYLVHKGLFSIIKDEN
ncbi:MAG: type III pantothenate kinase [Muribaculaceae bacterium]|nr:type III pantothenate kinase [Muribaculaceae bacterium]